MVRENLFKKLRKKIILPYVLLGSLFLNPFFIQKCPDENPPQKPVAVLTANPTEGNAPLYVEFDGSRSQGAIEEYIWNLDEITTLTTLGPYTNYTYEKGGKYYSSLIVVDNQGQRSNKASLEIIVNEDIVTLGTIAFWSNCDVPEGGYNEDIYSGDIIRRVKDDTIELRNIERLTTHPGQDLEHPGQDLEPAWSPDGKEILFTSHRTGGTAVWRMNADGTNQRDISSNIVERARQAHWGNNGKVVVAYRDLGDTVAGIGIIDLDVMGPNMNTFTWIYREPISNHIPGWPKWSPDCSKIVFQKYINENWEIFLMNADGTERINLTNHPATDGLPDWFFNGEKILFRSYRSGSADIYRMNTKGSNIRRITDNLGIETDPVYSPDGSKIIFAHDLVSFLNPQLYLMNANGTGWIQLTFDGANRYPAWKPKIQD